MHHIKKIITKELKTALDIALLKKPVMRHVAEDKKKTQFGYAIIIGAAVLSIIGQQIFGYGFFKPSLISSVLSGMIQVISAVVGIYVLSFIAKVIFKGHAKHDEFFRASAYAMIVAWLSILPQLSLISTIWGLVLMYIVLKTIHKVTTIGAIGTLLLGFIAMMILSSFLSPLYGHMDMGSMKVTGHGKSMEINIHDYAN